MQILEISLSLQSKFGSLTGDVSSYQQFFSESARKGLSGLSLAIPHARSWKYSGRRLLYLLVSCQGFWKCFHFQS